jgi:hypothetical protein
MGRDAVSLGIKLLGRQANQFHLFGAEVKNCGALYMLSDTSS